MTLSVVIVLWNAEATVASCLRSLHGSAMVTEVIAVDNASGDASADLAAVGGARVIRLDTNIGFAAAVNRGVMAAVGENLLLLNPDVQVERSTVERCLEALREPAVGLVGANLVREDGRPDPPAARRFRRLGYLLIETLGLPAISRRLDVQYLSEADRSVDRDVDAVNGAFMLIRRSLFAELGGMDESVFLFLEDQDLCRRVWEAGFRVRFVADARAIHVGGAATSRARSDQTANIYLHRMDASIELVHRLQGAGARRVAIALWSVRCLLGLASRGLRSPNERTRYGGGFLWLTRQWRRRVPPPPVP